VTTALIPGSFDPIHLGHVEVVETTARLFDEVVVAAVGNPEKSASAVFDLAEREELMAASLAHLPNVRTARWSGLVVHLAAELGAEVIVKGLRGVADFEYEVQMAHTNQRLTGVATMFLPSNPVYAFVASRFIREIARMGGSVEELVPAPVAARLRAQFAC
jgi:pantetheine-phosphate adenylyltransferase